MSDNTRDTSAPWTEPFAAREFLFHGRARAFDGITAGGARRDRTDDLLLAKQALSQLSYGPVGRKRGRCLIMVGLGRLELPTSRLSGVRSNHLSYRPDAKHTFSVENVSSCLKKEKRRRRNPALNKDPVRFQNRSVV